MLPPPQVPTEHGVPTPPHSEAANPLQHRGARAYKTNLTAAAGGSTPLRKESSSKQSAPLGATSTVESNPQGHAPQGKAPKGEFGPQGRVGLGGALSLKKAAQVVSHVPVLLQPCQPQLAAPTVCHDGGGFLDEELVPAKVVFFW